MATLQVSVQKTGNYSYLALAGLPAGAQTPSAGAGLPPPPLNEAMLGTPSTGTQTTQAQSAAEQSDLIPGRAWGGWFLGIRNRLNSLAPGARGQNAVSVSIEAPSIDETDIEWYAKLNVAVGIADPLIFTPGFSGVKSRYGRNFNVGDYVLIADSNLSGTTYNFEIAQLTAISAAGAWTLTRKSATSLPGQAQFGTPLVTHTPRLAAIPIYRLTDKFWNVVLPSPATPQLVKLPWDNMCCPAVLATAANLPPVLLNLIQPSPAPAVPGFRTLSGAEYTLGNPAAAALGGVSLLRLSVAGWHSIRNVFFEFDGAAPAGTATNITLAYIAPDRKAAYQVAKFVIAAGARVSYSTPPQNRRFPFSGIWPPHANLPLMVGGLSAAGVLQNGFTLAPSAVAMQEDGELDYIVTANASTPGVGLRGTVQT